MNMSDIDVEFCTSIIYDLANKFRSSLKDKVIHSFEDLIAEGWVVFSKCLSSFDESKGVKFETLLYTSVRNRFLKLLEYEFSKKRQHTVDYTPNVVQEIQSRKSNQESDLMLKQALEAIAGVSFDFTKMVVQSVPKDLLSLAKRDMRRKRYYLGSNGDGGTITFKKRLMENYFNVSLNDLSKIVYKYI